MLHHRIFNFFKKRYKIAPVYAFKKVLKKKTLTQNINIFVLIYDTKCMKSQQIYFCTKKDEKCIFSTKVVISKNPPTIKMDV